MKISVQSLFEDYEDDTVELRRDADTARILEKTMAKLPNARKKRPLRLVLIAAAAVAVLCGAAAIVHYASVEPAEQPYTLKNVLYRNGYGKLVRQDIDFTQDGAVTFDTDGKTDGFLCGISQIPQQANGIDAGLTSTLYESLSYADQYEGQHFLSSLSDEEKQQTKELITRINYHDKVGDDDCSVECLSANDVAGVDLLLWGHDTQLIKEGTINGLYAALSATQAETVRDVREHRKLAALKAVMDLDPETRALTLQAARLLYQSLRRSMPQKDMRDVLEKLPIGALLDRLPFGGREDKDAKNESAENTTRKLM